MAKAQRLKLRRVWLAGSRQGLGPGLAASSCGGGSPAAPKQWYATCGDVVCHGYDTKAGVPACTTEAIGASCATANASCDPMDSCNVLASVPKRSQDGARRLSRSRDGSSRPISNYSIRRVCSSTPMSCRGLACDL